VLYQDMLCRALVLGLVRGPVLVVAGGCEGLTPDITRWAVLLLSSIRRL
jgi:hypothetical protein